MIREIVGRVRRLTGRTDQPGGSNPRACFAEPLEGRLLLAITVEVAAATVTGDAANLIHGGN